MSDEPLAAPGHSRVIWYDPNLHQQQLQGLIEHFINEVNTERVRRAVSKRMIDTLITAERQIRERLHTDFTLAVVGNFKNGKSTLINALLGAEIVTTNVTPETVTINQIRYGPKHRIEAILTDGGRVQIPLEDMPAERLVPTLTTIRGGITRAETSQNRAERERELRQILIDCFNKAELRDLCFELGVDDEALSGDTINDKARELIAYMRRRSRLNDLIEACYKARPNITAINDPTAAPPIDSSRVAQRISRLEQLRDAISHLVIEAPIDWLRDMCLVDTPGMADLHGFDDQVRAFLPRCDAIIYVISARSPLSEEERNFLQRYVLPRDFAKIFFVLNRMDDMRSSEDAARVWQRVRQLIHELFPDAPLFGISALEAFDQLQHQSPLPPQVIERAAEFSRLRTMLQDSILLNRDVIRLERAVTQATQMLREFQASVAYLQQAIAANQDRRSTLIAQCENRSSLIHTLKEEQKQQMRRSMRTLAHQAIEWISAFLVRFEAEVVPGLSQVRLEEVQRYFHFFLADVLREAINNCLEAQRPLFTDLVAQRQIATNQPAPMGELLQRGATSDSAVRSTLNDISWAKLDDLNTMVDQSLVSIFALAEELVLPVAGLLFQRQRQSEPLRISAYQQQLREMLPELRSAIVTEIESLYHDLANEIDREIELAHQHDIEAALGAMRQAQEHHDAGQGEVDAVTTICDELRDLLDETFQELGNLRNKLQMDNETFGRDLLSV